MDRTPDKGENGGNRQDPVRDTWKKLIECEERLTFLKRMIQVGIGVRELEHLGDEIRERYRSERMKSGTSHREVIELVSYEF